MLGHHPKSQKICSVLSKMLELRYKVVYNKWDHVLYIWQDFLTLEAHTKIKQNGTGLGTALGFVKMPDCNHILFIFQDDTATHENLVHKKI